MPYTQMMTIVMIVSASHCSIRGAYSLYLDCHNDVSVMRLIPGIQTIQVGAKYEIFGCLLIWLFERIFWYFSWYVDPTTPPNAIRQNSIPASIADLICASSSV